MFSKSQFVCLVCGYNMVGYHPDNCPFCGAPKSKFLAMEEAMQRYQVIETRIAEGVSQLKSAPALGFEHAGYRLVTGSGDVWIDCPSVYYPDIHSPETILFTHHHFLGSSNLYRELGGAEIRIHQNDSQHAICRGFTFDQTFIENFVYEDIESFHIDGHTPGFTFYIFDKTLFVCDYVFIVEDGLKYNPFGPADETKEGGRKIFDIIQGRQMITVCGYNYTAAYNDWLPDFEELVFK